MSCSILGEARPEAPTPFERYSGWYHPNNIKYQVLVFFLGFLYIPILYCSTMIFVVTTVVFTS